MGSISLSARSSRYSQSYSVHDGEGHFSDLSMSRASLEEEAPLLGEGPTPVPSNRKRNPLPWRQLLLVLCIDCSSNLPGQSLRPYINQRIGQLDIINGDVRKVGYYVGLMGTIVNIISAGSVLQWSQLSDRIGRKPVLLFGLLVTMISIFWFGLARTYWALVVSRCLQGVTNGSHGVVKSIIGEITDATNRAQAFLWVFVLAFTAATVAGSLIGGMLVTPHERFPNVFGGNFWRQNPYFLPSFVVAIMIAAVFISTLLFLKESAPLKPTQNEDLEEVELPQSRPLPLRELVTHRPVIISSANYAFLALLGASQDALLPLFLAMPIDIGGLGFDPARIGVILGGYRAATAFLILSFSGTIIHLIGERRLYILGISTYLVTWTMLPVISLLARYFGVGIGVWTGIVIMVLPMFFTDMAGGCLNTYIVGSSPNRQSLGATNGFAQTCNAVASILAPLVADSLFSFSVQHNILGGYAVYPTLIVLTSVAISLARYLPHDIRPVWEREG